MIEKEQIMPLSLTPDEAGISRKPILFKIGFISALLGLSTPFLIFLVARLGFKLPCCGEGGTPGDGLMWMFLMIGGMAWWTVMEIVNLAFMSLGLAKKETGRIKPYAVTASALSLLLIVLIYAAAIALVGRNI